MNNLQSISDTVVTLASSIKLSLGTPDLVYQQLQDLQQTQTHLAQIEGYLTPYREQVQAAIAKIDAIRLAKAAAGIVLMLIANNNDGDDVNLLSELGSNFLHDLGSDLLDGAIHTENGLRELGKALNTLHHQVGVLTEQAITLQSIGEYYLKETALLEQLVPQSASLKSLKTKFANICNQLKFNFTFGQSADLKLQIASLETTTQKLIHFQEDLEILAQVSTTNTDAECLVIFIAELFQVLACGHVTIAYNNRNTIIFIFEDNSYTLASISELIYDLCKKCRNLLAQAEELQKLAEQCTHNPTFTKLIDTPLPAYSLTELENYIQQQIEQTPPILILDNSVTLQQQIQGTQPIQKQLIHITKRLNLIPQNFQTVSDLTTNILSAILSLLGQEFLGIGFDSSGVLVFYQTHSSESVASFLKHCYELHQSLQLPLRYSLTLTKLAEQCLSSQKFYNQFQHYSSNLAFNDLVQQVQDFQKNVRIQLAVENLKKLREQKEKLEEIEGQLTQIHIKLKGVLQFENPQTGIALNPISMLALKALTGTFSALGFNSKGDVILYQGENEEMATKLLTACQQLEQKVSQILQKCQESIKVAHQCREDVNFRKELVRKRQQQKLMIHSGIAAGILILLSPVGWCATLRYQQSKVYSNALAVVASTDKIESVSGLESLKVTQQHIQTAIADLEALKDFPGSLYQPGQKELVNLHNRLDTVNQKITQEEQAILNFNEAQKLAQLAASSVQTPPHSPKVWREVHTQWQNSIALLSAIPEGTSVSNLAKEKLAIYEVNAKNIERRLTDDETAAANLETAKKLSWEAAKMIQNPPHPLATWQRAKANLEQAIKLLQAVPSGTAVSIEAKSKLITYPKTLQTLNQRIATEEKALKILTEAQKNFQKTLAIANQTPYQLDSLRQALIHLQKVDQLLVTIPAGTGVTTSASNLQKAAVSNFEEITDKYNAIATCHQYNSSFCFEADSKLWLDQP